MGNYVEMVKYRRIFQIFLIVLSVLLITAGIKREEVFDIIAKYYPEKTVPVKTRFFVEELTESR